MNSPDPFANLRACRYCGELLAPIYGAVKPYPATSMAGAARSIADSLAGDDGRTYFECFKCQGKRRRRRIVFYSLLGALTLVVWLAATAFADDKTAKPNTWLRRNGKWQIIAVQDNLIECPMK